jgi:putative transposase
MQGRRRKHTTRQDPLAVPAPDLLVERNFAAPAPDKLWTADITYLPTDEGFLYVAFILDVSTPARWGRLVDGQPPAQRAGGGLSLEMAVSRRNPSAGLIHHIAIGERSTRPYRLARGLSKPGSCRLWVGWARRWITPSLRELRLHPQE